MVNDVAPAQIVGIVPKVKVGVPSMVTVKEQLTVLQLLVAVNVTVVTPTLKNEPLPLPVPVPVVAPSNL